MSEPIHNQEEIQPDFDTTDMMLQVVGGNIQIVIDSAPLRSTQAAIEAVLKRRKTKDDFGEQVRQFVAWSFEARETLKIAKNRLMSQQSSEKEVTLQTELEEYRQALTKSQEDLKIVRDLADSCRRSIGKIGNDYRAVKEERDALRLELAKANKKLEDTVLIKGSFSRCLVKFFFR